MSLLIGLSGSKGSGKSAIAQALLRQLPGSEIRALAAPLKQVCVEILGLDPQAVYGSDADKQALSGIRQASLPHWRCPLGGCPSSIPCPAGCARELTVREVLQQVGTELFRHIRPGCWIESLQRHARTTRALFTIVDDVRFRDEVEGILRCGGQVFRLTRGGTQDTHASERDLDGYRFFTATIDNTTRGIEGTVADILDHLELPCYKPSPILSIREDHEI